MYHLVFKKNRREAEKQQRPCYFFHLHDWFCKWSGYRHNAKLQYISPLWEYTWICHPSMIPHSILQSHARRESLMFLFKVCSELQFSILSELTFRFDIMAWTYHRFLKWDETGNYGLEEGGWKEGRTDGALLQWIQSHCVAHVCHTRLCCTCHNPSWKLLILW